VSCPCILLSSASSLMKESQKNFLALIPHPIESEWDARWAPRLAGFPVNICYGAGRSTGIVRSTYYFDPDTLVENEVSRVLRYLPRQKSEFWVEVIMTKQGGLEIRKYRAAELVCSAQGTNFRTVMIHATLRGLEPDEPIDLDRR
jgi:hypothetical protein